MSYNKNFFVLISLLFLLAIPSSLIAVGGEEFTEEERQRALFNFNKYVSRSNHTPSPNEDKQNYVEIRRDLIWKFEDYKKLFYSFIILSNFKVTPEIEKQPNHEGAFTGIFKRYLIRLHENKDSLHYIHADKDTTLDISILNAAYLTGKQGIPLNKEKLLEGLDEE